jgi:hypothetical protein
MPARLKNLVSDVAGTAVRPFRAVLVDAASLLSVETGPARPTTSRKEQGHVSHLC